MSETADTGDQLKRVLGAMLFGAKHPLTASHIRRVLLEAADVRGGEARAFIGVTEERIEESLRQIQVDCELNRLGFHLVQVANGYRFQSDPECGIWLKHLLSDQGRYRLSHPALETLAVIAYRQPVMRAEIEGVRGVNVDHLIALLLEMQLIRIVGRSELPGRPFQYGTTGYFLEHFGLKELKDLPAIEELSRRDAAFRKAAQSVPEAPQTPSAGEPNPAGEAAPGDAPAAPLPEATTPETAAPESEPEAPAEAVSPTPEAQA